MEAERELDRVLTLLRNKIRERGFTQLEVQEALSWGRSYISQLLTKQKSLRVEQVLLILEVIGVKPGEFFGELYHFPQGETPRRSGDVYPAHGMSGYGSSMIHEVTGDMEGGEFVRSFGELRSLLRGLVRLLVDKNLINVDDLTAAVKAIDAGRMADVLGTEGEDGLAQ